LFHRPRCLVLLAFEALSTGTVAQHASALRDFSSHDVELAHVGTLNRFGFDLKQFDVIAFHYSLVIAKGYHIGADLRSRLQASKALKFLFIQDEYRWIDATAAAIRELGISVIFTVVNRDVIDLIYHHEWLKTVRKEITLTGFVDERLLGLEVPEYEERTIDVVYRARKVPYWLGSFSMEKWIIGEKFRRDAEQLGLLHDISSDESARIYGGAWVEFLAGAKATLGTESGASICDFSGRIQINVEAAVARNPAIDFETIRKEILHENDGGVIIHVISPRVFEAAALRTLMINYPGDYSGRLTPWRHYVPLAKDHSNIQEVLEVIRSPDRAKKIIEAAYREVACNPENSFRAMVAHFDRVISEELGLKVVAAPASQGSRKYRRRIFGLEAFSWAEFYLARLMRRLRSYAFWAIMQVVPRRVRRWIRARLAG
jgi:hypothetical protein